MKRTVPRPASIAVGLALLLGLVVQVPRVQAATIWELIPDVSTTPIQGDGLSMVLEVEAFDGTVHIVGTYQQQPARQLVTLGGTPVIGPVEVFPSLDVQANPGTGSPFGGIWDVQRVNGVVTYAGRSDSPNAVQSPTGPGPEATVWNTAGNPTGLGFADPVNRRSEVHAMSVTGVGVGMDASQAITASEALGAMALPTLTVRQSGAVDISLDGTLIGGRDGLHGAVFWRGDPATQDYQEFANTLEAPPDGLNADILRAVIKDPAVGELGFGEYLNSTTFQPSLGLWNLVDGSFLWGFGPGTGLDDARMFGSDLVIGIDDGLGGDWLTTYDDMTQRYVIREQLGLDSFDLAQGGLWENSVGWWGTGTSGGESVVVMAEGSNPVPEPSSAVILLGLLPFLWLFRRRLRPAC